MDLSKLKAGQTGVIGTVGGEFALRLEDAARIGLKEVQA